MAEQRPAATPDNWWSPPPVGWTYEQVKDLELPFDWELVDGEIVVRGQAVQWHDTVRDRLYFQLELARREPLVANVERCVTVDEYTTVKPDVVLFDGRDLDPATLVCVPVDRVRLVVEVVSPGSRRKDRGIKPVIMAEGKVPYFWRVERADDHVPVVHEYWLNHDTGSYIPAPGHPVHHEKLVTDVPFPVEIDLRALARFF